MWRTARSLLERHGYTKNYVRAYLTGQFKSSMEEPIVFPSIIHPKEATHRLAAFEVESFVSQLERNKDRRDELFEKLLTLRASEQATSVSELINYGVINYLSAIDINDLLSILAHRDQYGIFVDSFTGCYLMDVLLENQNYQGAMQIAVELLIQEDFDNELCNAFAVKSCFQYLYNLYIKNSLTIEADEEPVEQSSEKPVKVRVKYLRNPPENPPIDSTRLKDATISDVLLKFSSHNKKLRNNENILVLAYTFSSNYEEVMNILRKSSGSNAGICNDILHICLKHLEKLGTDEGSANLKDLKVMIGKNIAETNETARINIFDKSLDEIIVKYVNEHEVQLIQKKNENFLNWIKLREEHLQAAIREQTKEAKEIEAAKAMAEIEAQKQLLWFFEQKDQLDLTIYNKRVSYPKRWFGKKKKPRAVDDNYVPPEIRKK